MKDKQIISVVIDAISFVQEMSGELQKEINELTVPINELKGFDSQRGIETTIEIETRLNIVLPDGLNLFVSKEGDRALGINEIVKRIEEIIKIKGK